MSTSTSMNGWNACETVVAAWREVDGEHARVEIDGDSVVVDATQGRGHSAQSTTTSVPVAIVIEMMRSAGYRVERERAWDDVAAEAIAHVTTQAAVDSFAESSIDAAMARAAGAR